MSFGFALPDPAIQQALRKARDKKVIFFAAASNGTGQSITFPASSPEVIGINSADGYGNTSSFNSPLREGKENFSVLGEALESFSPSSLGRGLTVRKSGTSFATPIAAGIAASILEFARHSFAARSPGLAAVSSPEGMRLLFSYMSSSRDGFAYVTPWKLFDTGSSREQILKRMLHVLEANLQIPRRSDSGPGRNLRLQELDAEERDEMSQQPVVQGFDDEDDRSRKGVGS
jgi:hypothetical protein